MDIHQTWKDNQYLLKDINLENFKKHILVRHYMLSTHKHTTKEEYLYSARELNPAVFDELFTAYVESNVGDPNNTNNILLKKTAIQFYYLMRIYTKIINPQKLNILEIGGGFGNLARIFTYNNMCNSYSIVDLNATIRIQKYFLENSLTQAQYEKVNFYDFETDLERLKHHTFDLVISTFALSETTAETMSFYINNIIKRAKYAYIVGQKCFGDFNCKNHLITSLSDVFTEMVYSKYPFYEEGSFELICKNAKTD